MRTNRPCISSVRWYKIYSILEIKQLSEAEQCVFVIPALGREAEGSGIQGKPVLHSKFELFPRAHTLSGLHNPISTPPSHIRSSDFLLIPLFHIIRKAQILFLKKLKRSRWYICVPAMFQIVSQVSRKMVSDMQCFPQGSTVYWITELLSTEGDGCADRCL